MTSTATEGGQAAPPTDPATPTDPTDAGSQTDPAEGAAPASDATPDPDELTAEEEAALGDPGKRAVQRMKEGRDQARTEHATATAELETTRSRVAELEAQIAAGGDSTQQQALQAATTERDAAVQESMRVMAALRNGMVEPRQGETPAAYADRVQKVAAVLQGADDAALDQSAESLRAMFGTKPAAPVTNGDVHAAPQGGAQAGQMSMSDIIRQKAGRKVGG